MLEHTSSSTSPSAESIRRRPDGVSGAGDRQESGEYLKRGGGADDDALVVPLPFLIVSFSRLYTSMVISFCLGSYLIYCWAHQIVFQLLLRLGLPIGM
mmetsp:Transcript_38915/g.58459  ORF Transcript_38915/g.58459 Transcript_38915/m.58459 type:complete len:98 (-) Transcript_38915:8-301(-)